MEQQIKNEFIAEEMINYLKKRKLWIDSAVYVNGKRINSEGTIEEGIDVTQYLEFCNPESISMIFEGPLYSHLNGHVSGSTVFKQLEKIANKYGCYIQPGYAWSFTLYDKEA